jgi:hypothetical protein
MRFTSESRSIRFHQHGYKLNGNIVLLIHSHDSSLRASSLYASWLLATLSGSGRWYILKGRLSHFA